MDDELVGGGRFAPWAVSSTEYWELNSVRWDSYTKSKSEGAVCALGRELHGVPEAQRREVELVHEVEVQGGAFRPAR